ncbi:MAG TPA: 16S rRNA (guanine(527)-N(7))-methyltransferase RsmG [Xanthobacteraceae bacterium]|nr:16S rRNA (guanine(527)-N(7))-methyltransferase RsmG [Xanthobacteraceae bacterium]
MRRSALDADRAAALRLIPVSRETLERIDAFVALLLQWERAVPLVANADLPKLWTRHIADSLQLIALAPAAKRWTDLGSGGGFPGLVIAMALAQTPGACVHLVESDQRKAAFLRAAIRDTDAPAKVYAERIESAAKRLVSESDVVTARALAPLPGLLELAAPFLAKQIPGIFPKGQDVDNELTEATKSWKIQSTIVPSRTQPHGRIVVVERASPRISNISASEGNRP